MTRGLWEKSSAVWHRCLPSADKQVNSDASPSHQVKGNASPATNTDDKQLNVDASTSHQDKGNAITSLATNKDEMSSEESDSQVPPINLLRYTDHEHILQNLYLLHKSVGCDDTGFTLL
ncbi:hypothetical protein D5086_003993 [Populus alba]|uniref:Uncharacterized protein n=1 Tax=Populus alba TaxID=43335 RepID=A0ACC4D6E9_POPAL